MFSLNGILKMEFPPSLDTDRNRCDVFLTVDEKGYYWGACDPDKDLCSVELFDGKWVYRFSPTQWLDDDALEILLWHLKSKNDRLKMDKLNGVSNDVTETT